MKMLKNKLKSRIGATMLMALLLLLIVVMVCFVVIQAAMSSSSALTGEPNPYAEGGSQADLDLTVDFGTTAYVYDGEPHSAEPAVYGGGNKLTPGVDYTVTYDPCGAASDVAPTLTDVGSLNVEVTIERNGNISEYQYTLTVSPLTVTVKANDLNKVYGTSDPELTVSVTPASASVQYSVSRAAGEKLGEYTITPSGQRVQGNYVVSYETGTLLIRKSDEAIVVNIVGNNDTLTYDRQAHTLSGYTVSGSGFDAGKILYKGSETAVPSVTKTEAGTYALGLKAEDFSYSDDNLNIVFNVTDGQLTIDKAKFTVSVTGNNVSRVYNGSERSLGGYNAACSDAAFLLSNVEYGASTAIKQTNAGKYYMNLDADEFSYKDSSCDVTFNIAADGYLEIKKASMTVNVTGNTYSEYYSGETISKNVSYTLASTSALYDSSKVIYSGKTSVGGINVGTYKMQLSAAGFSYSDSANIDVTFNIVSDGYLEIKDSVTISLKTVSDRYKEAINSMRRGHYGNFYTPDPNTLPDANKNSYDSYKSDPYIVCKGDEFSEYVDGYSNQTTQPVTYNGKCYSDIVYNTQSASELNGGTSTTRNDTVSADGSSILLDVSVKCTAVLNSSSNSYSITIVLTCGGTSQTVTGSITYNDVITKSNVDTTVNHAGTRTEYNCKRSGSDCDGYTYTWEKEKETKVTADYDYLLTQHHYYWQGSAT